MNRYPQKISLLSGSFVKFERKSNIFRIKKYFEADDRIEPYADLNKFEILAYYGSVLEKTCEIFTQILLCQVLIFCILIFRLYINYQR